TTTPLISDLTSCRPHHHNLALRRDERRQQHLGDGDDANDVDLVHRPPLVKVRCRYRIGAIGSAGVVHQQVTARTDCGSERGDVVRGGHVANHCPAADFHGQGSYLVSAPGCADDLEAFGGKSAGRGGTDAAACSGHHGQGSLDLVHPASINTPGGLGSTGGLSSCVCLPVSLVVGAFSPGTAWR